MAICLLGLVAVAWQPLSPDEEALFHATEAGPGQEEVNCEEVLYLNSATEQELESSGIFSSHQLQNLIAYRDQYDCIHAPYELTAIAGFDRMYVEMIRDCLVFSAPCASGNQHPGTYLERSAHRLLFRYQQSLPRPKRKQTGSSSGGKGVPAGLYLRYKLKTGSGLTAGLSMEQDAGEPFGHPGQLLMLDYISGYISGNQNRRVREWILGDYEVRLGQGLCLYQGFSPGKGWQMNRIRNRRDLLRPHGSRSEMNFSRGAAADIRISAQWSVLTFISWRKRDAVIKMDNGTRAISSLPVGGLHRTDPELAARNAAGHTMTGVSLTRSDTRSRVSLHGTWQCLTLPYVAADRPYNRYRFSGKTLFNAGLEYHYLRHNSSLFGEIALSTPRGWAMIHGINLLLPGHAELALGLRWYPKNYRFLFAKGFGERGQPNNEYGIYSSLTFSPHPAASCSVSLDIFRHPWLSYRRSAPSNGVEARMQATIRYHRQHSLILRGSWKILDKDAPSDRSAIKVMIPYNYLTGSIRHETVLSSAWRVRVRLMYRAVFASQLQSLSGFLNYWDIIYSARKIPIKIYARYTIFQSEGAESRLAAYENDILYDYAMPVLHGRGARYYLMVKLEPVKGFNCWLRWSNTKYWHTQAATSSNDLSDGSHSNMQIKLLCTLRF